MIEAEVRDLLATIASGPRPAGSESEAAARAVCATWLRNLGFDVVERPFTYSAWPGLYGTSIVGMALLAIALGAAYSISVLPARLDQVMTLTAASVAAVSGCAIWLSRFGTRLVPLMRREGINLEATRGEPPYWFMAHLDSKTQPVSLLGRAAASVTVGLLWLVAGVLWLPARLGWVGPTAIVVVLAVAGAAAIPLIFAVVGGSGSGALDNASGVAAVLSAARLLPATASAGVVITSAEELGLAGARAWVRGRPSQRVMNCDGVDDRGAITVTLGRRGGGLWGSEAARRAAGRDVRFRRTLPGVLLDAIACSDAGWPACTVSRGGIGSLRRVHTRRDTMQEMKGAGVLETAQKMLALGGAIIA